MICCSDGIIRWVKKKTGPPADTVKTVAELEKLESDNEVIIVGFFKAFKVGMKQGAIVCITFIVGSGSM